jgi:hypothetical protein
VSSQYLGEQADLLRQMDFIQDINEDGLDDIIDVTAIKIARITFHLLIQSL